eukprot:jgi/Mesvir1/25632/Mv01852-RA.1
MASNVQFQQNDQDAACNLIQVRLSGPDGAQGHLYGEAIRIQTSASMLPDGAATPLINAVPRRSVSHPKSPDLLCRFEEALDFPEGAYSISCAQLATPVPEAAATPTALPLSSKEPLLGSAASPFRQVQRMIVFDEVACLPGQTPSAKKACPLSEKAGDNGSPCSIQSRHIPAGALRTMTRSQVRKRSHPTSCNTQRLENSVPRPSMAEQVLRPQDLSQRIPPKQANLQHQQQRQQPQQPQQQHQQLRLQQPLLPLPPPPPPSQASTASKSHRFDVQTLGHEVAQQLAALAAAAGLDGTAQGPGGWDLSTPLMKRRQADLDRLQELFYSDPLKATRVMKNRESAARSRASKAQRFAKLQQEVKRLTEEKMQDEQRLQFKDRVIMVCSWG